MKLIFSPLAQKQLKKLPKVAQILIARKVRKLGERNYSGVKVLAGYKGVYRLRIGDYRLVYRKYPDKLYFILVGHGKEIYLFLKKLVG